MNAPGEPSLKAEFPLSRRQYLVEGGALLDRAELHSKTDAGPDRHRPR